MIEDREDQRSAKFRGLPLHALGRHSGLQGVIKLAAMVLGIWQEVSKASTGTRLPLTFCCR